MNRTALLLVTTLVAAGITGGDSAFAGTYAVRACDDAPGFANSAFVSENSDPIHFEVASQCPGPGLGANALVARDIPGSTGFIASGARAGWRVSAPVGVSVGAITMRRALGQEAYYDKVPRVEDGSGQLLGPDETCILGPIEGTCEKSGSVSYATATSSVWIGIVCVPQAGATVCTNGATISEGWASLYGATVTFTQSMSPTIAAPAGSLTSGGWLSGDRELQLASVTDASGVRTLSLAIDGRVAPITGTAPTPVPCDFTRPRPCADLPSNSVWSVRTSALADGEHTAVVTATNAAEMPAMRSVTFRTDQTPPAAPTNLQPSSSSWLADRDVTLTWGLPPQGAGSPTDAARVHLCGPTGACRDLGAPSLTAASVTLADGTWTASVRLHDAAGWGAASTRTLNIDATPAPAPTGLRTATAGWSSQLFVPIVWDTPDDADDRAPIVGARVRVCDETGSVCGPPDEPATTTVATAAVPGEGVWKVKVSNRKANGVVDDDLVAETLVRVSTTPPTTRLTDVKPASIGLGFTATFTAAAGGPAPLETVSWRLCGSSGCPLSGAAAGGTITGTAPTAGTWTLTVDAVDQAGKTASDSRTFTISAPNEPPQRRDNDPPPSTDDRSGGGGVTEPPQQSDDPPASGTPTPPGTGGGPAPSTTTPRASGLKLGRATLNARTLTAMVSTASSWSGRVQARFRYRTAGRTLTARGSVAVRRGRGRLRLRLKIAPARGRLTLTISRTPATRAATVSQTVRRR